MGETFGGKSAVRDESTLLLGGVGVCGTAAATKIAAEADLVICVGTRLTDFATGSQSAFQHPDVKFISINVASHDAYKQGALAVTADARESLSQLQSACKAAGIRTSDDYRDEIATAREAWSRKLQEEAFQQAPDEIMSQAQLIAALNQSAQPGDTIVAAAGGPPGDLLRLWGRNRWAPLPYRVRQFVYGI